MKQDLKNKLQKQELKEDTLQQDDAPQIYVACLASYNAGRLHGSWIPVETKEQIQEDIQKILRTSQEPFAEEWAIHDFDGFGGAQLSEYEDFDALVTLKELIEAHDETLVGALYNYFSGGVEEVEKVLQDQYLGCFESIEDYAMDYIESTGSLRQLPESLQYYFDYERFARDLEMGGDIFTIETSYREVHVFSNY